MKNAFRIAAPVLLALGVTTAFAQTADTSAVGKTREQVRAELNEAIRNGSLIADGETGQTFAQLFPGSYSASTSATASAAAPKAVAVTGKTREQVRAETMEALRLGLLTPNYDETPKIATPAQSEQIRLAGLRAVNPNSATAQAPGQAVVR